MNVRSLVNFDRRAKLANAITSNNYNIICLCETWLNVNIASSELLLDGYDIFRADRKALHDQYPHGGSLIAVKNNFAAEEVHNPNMPDSSIACKITICDVTIIICVFYNPPASSKYRYELADFINLLNFFPKTSQLVICGDINFPETNWSSLTSLSDYEQQVLDEFEDRCLLQAIDFKTCGQNILDVAFYSNCHIHAKRDDSFENIYDCSDHHAILLQLECALYEKKPTLERCRSFGSGDYDAMNEAMRSAPFDSICHTNIDKMTEELYKYFDSIIERHVPRRTFHRQQLPPWITRSTSHLIKQLGTQKRLLSRKPTSYRKTAVTNLENIVFSACETDRKNYQEELMGSRNTDGIFKHLKSLKKSISLPNEMTDAKSTVTAPVDKINLLNNFFQSVFSSKKVFTHADIKAEQSILTNFNVSKSKIRKILSSLDVTKTRGPNGLPPIFFNKTALEITPALHKLLRNIKRLGKLPATWKTAAVSPIFKKGDRRSVENWRPISLLNIDSKVLEKCMYEPLYNHFEQFLTHSQHGFTRGRSVMTNMLLFQNKIHKALDNNSQDDVVAFYTDFSKAFDKVPHFELLQKVANTGVGGCFLEVLVDYLKDRKQYVRVDNQRSITLPVNSGVPQGSLLGPLLFCIFINDLPDRLKFSEPYIFADDLKILAIKPDSISLQRDLRAIESWVNENKMSLAMDKCAKLTFRGINKNFKLMGSVLESSSEVKDLGVMIDQKLSSTRHVDVRLAKARNALYYVRRNVAYQISRQVKLGLYKSLILPILTYGFHCYSPNRTDLNRLERFQRKAIKWIMGNQSDDYKRQLSTLNLLPLPMFLQVNDLLLFSSLCDEQHEMIPPRVPPNRRTRTLFETGGARTEKARSEFFFRNSRLANRLNLYIIFDEKAGLKSRILKTMKAIFEERFSFQNVCTWQAACDCHQCRDLWTTI